MEKPTAESLPARALVGRLRIAWWRGARFVSSRLSVLPPLRPLARGKRADGQAGRGSSALSGFADIIMGMSCYRRARSRDRRRRIYAYSRSLDETPRHLIIELNADATDYLLRTNPSGKSIVNMWLEVQMVLGDATDKLSQQEILQRWPSEEGPPDRTTLSRWLKRAAQQGLICCCGSGYRGDSFRYWLPGREPR